MVDLSVIVVSFNTRELLRHCLKSVMVCSQEVSLEVWVVDNNSGDDSCETVAAEFPQVHLIQNSTNVGFAAANNQAMQTATGRYLLLLNSDTVVYPEAFRSLVGFMDQHEQAGYCGPKLVNGDGSHQPSARRFPTLLSRAFTLTGWDRRHPQSRHCLNLHWREGTDEPFRADWLTGACLMVRRQAYEQVGLLDEGFFMYFEETDWCRRMTQAGWEGWYVPSAKITHLGGQSVGVNESGKAFSGDHPVYWVASNRYYMRRHFGLAGMIFTEAVQIILYAILWMRHCWRRNDRSRMKARRSAASLRYLLARTHSQSASKSRTDT